MFDVVVVVLFVSVGNCSVGNVCIIKDLFLRCLGFQHICATWQPLKFFILYLYFVLTLSSLSLTRARARAKEK
jgi:hypothetical protein